MVCGILKKFLENDLTELTKKVVEKKTELLGTYLK